MEWILKNKITKCEVDSEVIGGFVGLIQDRGNEKNPIKKFIKYNQIRKTNLKYGKPLKKGDKVTLIEIVKLRTINAGHKCIEEVGNFGKVELFSVKNDK